MAARNNLATILLNQADTSGLAEAQSLAQAAADAKMGEPDGYVYLDTLARIYLKQRDYKNAIATFAKADQINKNNLIIMIGLADTLAQSGNPVRARGLIAQVDQQLQQSGGPNPLSDELQNELKSTRDAVNRKANTTPGARSSVSDTDTTPASPRP
jgi:predicted Zn-dependent protease